MNGRENEAFVMERLDKAYASIEWINSYPHYALQNHPILRSDHGSILLDFDLQQPFRRRPFRFERCGSPTPIVSKSWRELGRLVLWVLELSNCSRILKVLRSNS